MQKEDFHLTLCIILLSVHGSIKYATAQKSVPMQSSLLFSRYDFIIFKHRRVTF